MDPGPLRDVLVVVLGFATGVLSGLFGVGGGVISQPGMRAARHRAAHRHRHRAAGHHPGRGQRQRPATPGSAWSTGAALVATIPGRPVAAFAGGLLAESVPGEGHLLQVITAVLLGFSACRMWNAPARPGGPGRRSRCRPSGRRRRRTQRQHRPRPASDRHLRRHRSRRRPAVGPARHRRRRADGARPSPTSPACRVKRAIATSLVCVGAFAVPGTITHAIAGHVDWRVAAAPDRRRHPRRPDRRPPGHRRRRPAPPPPRRRLPRPSRP